jgi:hypothetical protein
MLYKGKQEISVGEAPDDITNRFYRTNEFFLKIYDTRTLRVEAGFEKPPQVGQAPRW